MKLQDLLNSHVGTALGLGLSRVLPPKLGYFVARIIADFLSSREDSPIVQSVRSNQWIVQGGQVSDSHLDRLVRDTFRSSAYSMYEFWHYYNNPHAVLSMVEIDPSLEEAIELAKHTPEGTLMVAPHISNFDVIGRALALHGLEMQILSYPQPPGGYRWQNQLRQIPGVLVTPMSIQALRTASQSLRSGLTVLTGVDRPLPDSEDAKYRSRFFGRAAALPVFYTRLALKHNLPITVLGACRRATGRYRAWVAGRVQLQHSADLMEETIVNTESVLQLIAGVIRRAPEQWAMFYPVWPEVTQQMNT